MAGFEFSLSPAITPILSVSRPGGEPNSENAANRTLLLPQISFSGNYLAGPSYRICDRSPERQREGKALSQRRIHEITQNFQLSCIHHLPERRRDRAALLAPSNETDGETQEANKKRNRERGDTETPRRRQAALNQKCCC